MLREALRVDARIVIPAAVLAEAVGALCGRTGTSDVVDASLVLVARRSRALVVTGDAEDIRRLDPTLAVEAL